jgi:hypothetical protein
MTPRPLLVYLVQIHVLCSRSGLWNFDALLGLGELGLEPPEALGLLDRDLEQAVAFAL